MLTRDLLRRKIGHRAHDLIGCDRLRTGRAHQPKIGEFDRVIAIDQHIIWLDIAVHQALIVHGT